MKIHLIKQEALEKLEAHVQSNLSHYCDKDPFLKSFFEDELNEQQWDFLSSYPDVEFNLKVSSSPKDDVENAIHIFKQLQFLTPSEATDKRLWAYLTHIYAWDYMKERWSVAATIEKSKKDYYKKTQDKSLEDFILGKGTSFINERYFFRSKFLYRQGLARLWWSAHLTYDDTRDDPFELLRVLFHNQDIATQVLERSFSHSRKTHHAFLQYLKERFLDKGINIKREPLRDMTKYIMFVRNVKLIDTLSPIQLNNLFDKCALEAGMIDGTEQLQLI